MGLSAVNAFVHPCCSSMALIFLVEAVKSASAQQFWSAVDKWWHNMAAYHKTRSPCLCVDVNAPQLSLAHGNRDLCVQVSDFISLK